MCVTTDAVLAVHRWVGSYAEVIHSTTSDAVTTAGKKFSMNLDRNFYSIECKIDISVLHWFT